MIIKRTQRKTVEKLKNFYLDLLWKKKFYSIQEIRRRYWIEYREVVKYILPLLKIKKRRNLLGKNRFELIVRDNVRKNIELIKKMNIKEEKELMLYEFLLYDKFKNGNSSFIYI